MAMVASVSNVSNHPHQLVHHLSLVAFRIIVFNLYLERERNKPQQFSDPFARLIVFEPSKVDRQEIRQGLNQGFFLSILQISTIVTFEFVTASHFLGQAIARNAVVERHIWLRQNEAKVNFFFLSFRD